MAVSKIRRDISSSKKIVLATCFVLLILIFWNLYSVLKLQQSYQHALMDSVTNSVLSEYQEHLAHLRAQIGQFQFQHYQDIEALTQQGALASKEDYMLLLGKLKQAIPEVRLFSIIDNQGQGTLKHITGDFLPDCKDEIHHTISAGHQESLFLHRSKTSIHFDVLEYLVTKPAGDWFFFVAFNTTVFEELLSKYQLPYQQLFLLRKDNIGKIELSTTTINSEDSESMSMQENDIQTFSFVKNIPDTRWQVAIRMAPDYTTKVIQEGAIKAFILWLFTSGLIFAFYHALRKRISRQHAMEKALEFESSHDSLTGTINRSTFEKRLEETITNGTVINNELELYGCVLLIDIDNFQLINNTHGYAEGDNCLNLLSHWLIQFLPNNAIVSRLGNDEFAVLLSDLAHKDTKNYANTIRESIQLLKFSRLGDEIQLTASIGAFNLLDESQDVGTVFNCLSHAVKLAKQKGRNRVQVYQSEDSELRQHALEMTVIKDVRMALVQDNFVLHRQYIQPLQATTTSDKYEILLRLKNNDGDIVAPNVFIPACEKYGLIKEVDWWVIRATFKAIQASEHDKDTHYSINLSGVTLADKDTFGYVSHLLNKYQINPARIGFEVTETYAITHLKTAMSFITKMTELGCEFSLDDFGIGLSNFSYLQQIPVHNIKIDGSFIRGICTNRLNQVFVESMHNVAVEMGKKTIAEFVEDEATQTYLATLGINMAQGYHCHKPEFWYEIK